MADCYVQVLSFNNEPVGGASVSWTDLATNTSLNTSLSESDGWAYYSGVCDNVSITSAYPSSAYAAVLSNLSVLSDVHLNDYVTASIQLKNTLGEYLEGQDCRVVILKANTSEVVHDYDTSCKIKPALVCSGSDVCNYQSVSDCKFTDSMGMYFFKGSTAESLGFEYDQEYSIVFDCNGQTGNSTFRMGLDKAPADMNKIEYQVYEYGGYIVVGAVFGAIGLIVLAFVLWLLFGKK